MLIFFVLLYIGLKHPKAKQCLVVVLDNEFFIKYVNAVYKNFIGMYMNFSWCAYGCMWCRAALDLCSSTTWSCVSTQIVNASVIVYNV